MTGHADTLTFSRCVIGYRAWRLSGDDELWPVHDHRRPWVPGINVARCNCSAAPGALRFQWTSYKGQRRLDLAPQHAAPGSDCACGLHCWRAQPRRWSQDPAASQVPRVIGAVACWGRIQVHNAGLRAQYACAVSLAHHRDADPADLTVLHRVADRYQAELVPLTELIDATERHGSALPATLGPPDVEPPPPPQPKQASRASTPIPRAPDAGPDDVALPEPVGFDGRPLHHTGSAFSGGSYPGVFR